jgi:hypothetical protein
MQTTGLGTLRQVDCAEGKLIKTCLNSSLYLRQACKDQFAREIILVSLFLSSCESLLRHDPFERRAPCRDPDST